ncbi:hypothetical protein EW026_g356 [Hermanssonia centrifuga]|uniref:Choline kinase n=1 Tax=Hermanssonia centrifuga TaxID=98765 RepID=A0A4S4KVF2_9APHY|nr:hypothetical protein EW026_g356 [Hermanssonia centrifuga]
MRDSKISSWIGARMAELHQVDIAAVALQESPTSPSPSPIEGEVWEAGVKKNVKSWLVAAREVLALPSVPEDLRGQLDLEIFERDWDQYISWLKDKERRESSSPIVFSHNDAQYGNLLRLTTLKDGAPEHRQIIVVDFEYASPNPAAFDIANHFHEWTANYHGETPHVLDPARYPTLKQRRNFYRAYLTYSHPSTLPTRAPTGSTPTEVAESEMQTLESQVRAWSPASHAMWAIWGIVQAREALEGKDGEPEFDYVGYAKCRMEGFYREIRALCV